MGTNFYMMTRNSELAHKHFADDYGWGVINETYKIVDEPYLGYEIHLNKLSCGWRPLFQKHKAFQSWRELEDFVNCHSGDIEFYDEYGRQYEFEDYKERVFNHVDVEPRPLKWVYDYPDHEFFGGTKNQRRLYLKECKPEEADIWTPFDHVKYFETENDAKVKFGVWSYKSYFNHWNDPNYPFDWTEGDFS